MFIQTTAVVQTSSGTTLTTASFTDVTGDTIIVMVVGIGAFNSFVYSDGQANSYAQKVASVTGNGAGTSTYIAVGTVASGGPDTVTVTTGGSTRIYAIWAEEYRNVNGYGVIATAQNDAISGGSTTYTSTLTFTNTAGSGSAVVELDQIGTPAQPGVTYNNAQTQRQSCLVTCNGNSMGTAFADDYAVAAASFTLSETFSWSGGCGAPPACFDSHSGLELLGSASVPLTSVTQCYGNCGTPAVTLANTNSTHSINWNFSLTFFYEFQPTISGFLTNITTNLAKTYPSTFQAPFLGLYQSNCPVGQTPFSGQCPANLLLGGQTSSASKGRQSIPGGVNFPITSSATIWYGVALSFQFAPEDVNDTNTAMTVQRTGGTMSPQITGSVSIASSKIGMWAWITGNIISSLPPPTPASVCTNNFATLDCMLPALANGSCAIVTAACQTSGSLFWIIILTLLVFFVATVGMSSAHITKFIGAGEIFLFVFLGWFFIFAGVGLIESFVVVMFLFIGSVAFAKSTRQYF